MGALLSYFYRERERESAEVRDEPGLDAVDPKTGLSAREKRVMEENWVLVEKDVRGNGVDFFLALFRAHPSYQKYFKSFADVPMDQLRENRKLHAHAFSVMYAISSMVNNLDDIECLVEVLTKTGRSHTPRNVKIEHFENLSVVFLDFMAEKLGPIFTPFARTAWSKAFKVINSVIQQGLEE